MGIKKQRSMKKGSYGEAYWQILPHLDGMKGKTISGFMTPREIVDL